MGNSLRCCLACVLPCGALDLIRIVHLNGYVEEIPHPTTAGEILKSNPNHILTKPSSQGVVRKILILSPDSELKRGSIYFLIPVNSLSDKKNSRHHNNHTVGQKKSVSSTNKSKKHPVNCDASNINDGKVKPDCNQERVAVSKKKSSRRREHKTGQCGAWRPHLESISEEQ